MIVPGIQRKVGHGGNYWHLEGVVEHRPHLREEAEQDERLEQAEHRVGESSS